MVYAVLDIAMTGTYPVEGLRLGLSRGEALHLVGWMAAGTVLVQPLAGWMADRFGSRQILGWLAFAGLVASIAAGVVSARYLPGRIWPATLVFTLVACAAGGIFPVSLSILGERTPAVVLPRANAAFSAVFGYASLLAPIVTAGFIDVMESYGWLGWAVPSLAILTFAAGLPLVWADRTWVPATSPP